MDSRLQHLGKIKDNASTDLNKIENRNCKNYLNINK